MIEILIVTSVSAAIGVLLIQLLVSNNGLFYDQSSKVNQGLTLNNSTAKLESIIRSGASIASSYPESSPQYITNDSTLVIKIPAIDTNDQAIPDIFDFVVVSKEVSNPRILKKYLFPTSPSTRIQDEETLLTNLSQVTFNYLDKDNNQVSPPSATKVNFILKVSEKIGLEEKISSASSEVNLRND